MRTRKMKRRWPLLISCIVGLVLAYILLRIWNQSVRGNVMDVSVSTKYGYGPSDHPLNSTLIRRKSRTNRTRSPLLIQAFKLKRSIRNRPREVNPYSTIFYNRGYFDFRNPDQAEFRVIAFRRCRSRKRLHAWFIMAENLSLSGEELVLHQNATPVLINRYCPLMGKNCTWDSFQVRVQLPPDVLRCPECVEKVVFSHSYLTWKPKHSGTAEFSDIQVVNPPNPSNPPKIQLAVCLQPIYLFADWMQLVQFFEIWKAIGAEKIYIYETSKTRNVAAWIDAYEKSGFIERIPWPLLPNSQDYDPNHFLYRVGHLGAIHDCILRTSGIANFVALVDSDEFILPLNPSQPLVQYLQEADLHYNRTLNAGYRFTHSLLHYPEDQLETSEIEISALTFDHLTELNQIVHTRGLPKLIVHPHGINTVSIHGFRLSMPGYHAHRLRGARLYHIRRPFAAWKSKADKLKKGSYESKFHRLRGIFPNIESNFAEFRMRYGHNLPESMDMDVSLMEELKECLADWKELECKVPHESCSDLLQGSPESWIIYDSKNTSNKFLALN